MNQPTASSSDLSLILIKFQIPNGSAPIRLQLPLTSVKEIMRVIFPNSELSKRIKNYCELSRRNLIVRDKIKAMLTRN